MDRVHGDLTWGSGPELLSQAVKGLLSSSCYMETNEHMCIKCGHKLKVIDGQLKRRGKHSTVWERMAKDRWQRGGRIRQDN